MISRLLCVVLLASCSDVSTAADFNYNYLDGGLLEVSPAHTTAPGEVSSGTITGETVGLSWEPTAHIDLLAGYARVSHNETGSCEGLGCDAHNQGTQQLREYSLGPQVHGAMNEHMDWEIAGTYVHASYAGRGDIAPNCLSAHACNPSLEFADSDAAATGYDLDAGIRWQVAESWELDGGVGHRHMSAGPQLLVGLPGTAAYQPIGDGSSNFVHVKLLWALSAHWVLYGGMVHFSTPHNRLVLGVRFGF